MKTRDSFYSTEKRKVRVEWRMRDGEEGRDWMGSVRWEKKERKEEKRDVRGERRFYMMFLRLFIHQGERVGVFLFPSFAIAFGLPVYSLTSGRQRDEEYSHCALTSLHCTRQLAVGRRTVEQQGSVTHPSSLR